jgi:hypothetical protein
LTRTSWEMTLLRTTAPETMQPWETMELMAMPVRPGSPKTNLAGGYWRGAGADGPAVVVEVEDGGDRGHVHVGVVVGLERADVAPVEGFLAILVDEIVGEHFVLAEDGGQDVVAEVVLRLRVFGVANEGGEQDVGIENVDAHGGVDHAGVEGGADVGFLRLLEKAGDLAVAGDLDDAEAGDVGGLDGQGGEGDVGAGVDMLAEHLAVVHLVDVVAGEDEDVPGLLGADGVDVLVDGVGGCPCTSWR